MCLCVALLEPMFESIELLEDFFEWSDGFDPCHLDQRHFEQESGVAGLCDVFGCGGEEPEHLLNAFGCFVDDELLEVVDFAGGEVDDFGGVLADFGNHHIAQEACEFLGEVSEVIGVRKEVFDVVEYGIDIAL